MTCLYLAPHLDDVAFSCAGGLLARIGRGERVVVATVFTRGGAGRLAAARLREDRTALSKVGAEHVHLDMEDAPGRLGVRAGFETLVLGPGIQPAVVAQVGRAIRRLVKEREPSEVWLPLGVGGHIDHLTVFAARRSAGTLARYYEERPYAFVPAFRTLRRLQLLGGRRRTPPGALAIGRQIDGGGCGAMLSDHERAGCLGELAARLAQRHRGELGALRTSVHRFDADALVRAAELIQTYRSETDWLFGSVPVREIWRRLAAGKFSGSLRLAPRGFRASWFEREIRVLERG